MVMPTGTPAWNNAHGRQNQSGKSIWQHNTQTRQMCNDSYLLVDLNLQLPTGQTDFLRGKQGGLLDLGMWAARMEHCPEGSVQYS